MAESDADATKAKANRKMASAREEIAYINAKSKDKERVWGLHGVEAVMTHLQAHWTVYESVFEMVREGLSDKRTQEALDKERDKIIRMVENTEEALGNIKWSLSKPKSPRREAHIGPRVKLPTLQVPTFSGNYKEWKPFYDAFQSIIHNNTTLPNITKLHYLKDALKEGPAKLLENVLETDDNYQIAMDLQICSKTDMRSVS